MKKPEKARITDFIEELRSRYQMYTRDIEVLNAKSVVVQMTIEELEEIVNKIKD